MDNLVVGVDIGGSHITAALVNVTRGSVLQQTVRRKMVDAEAAADDIINEWAALLKEVMSLSNVDQQLLIGIAMPGPFDYENGICLIKEQKKFRSLYEINIRNILAAKLHIDNFQVHFLNDACSFLCGELLGGVVKGEDKVIGITLGTGLGSAFYKDRSCTDAELWSHGFKEGIAEDYLSTRWFTSEFRGRFGIDVKGVKEMLPHIQEDSSKAIIFEDFAVNLAQFLLEVYKKTGCSTVVLGGNISKTAGYFLGKVEQELKKNEVALDIRISETGESAVIMGAAGEAQNQARKKTVFPA